MAGMAGVNHQKNILDTIDSLRKRKARPDLERICHMVERKYGVCSMDVISELERMVDAEIVIKVDYKGNTSYRNAAKWCKSKLSGSQLNSNDATRAILAAIEKLSTRATPNEEPDAETEANSRALAGVGLPELEKFFADQDPDTKFNKSTLEESLRREISARRIYVNQTGNYVLAKYAITIDDPSVYKLKRGRPPLKRKRIKKTHGPDFEQEPLTKTSSSWDQRCDYCSLPASCNQFGDMEELLFCKDCTLKVHPTCMKYSRKLAERSRLSPWQCIDCKTCHVCNDAGDADTLLFCDACDKGYHMVCHQPPVNEKPIGKWVCEMCASEDMEIGSTSTDEEGSISSTSSVSTHSVSSGKGKKHANNKSPNSTPGKTTPEVATPNVAMMANLPEQSAQSSGNGLLKAIATDPSSWSIDSVAKYFEENGFAEQAPNFKDQEIDGQSLLLLRRSDVLTGLSIKLGPALKIYKHVSELQLYQAKELTMNGTTTTAPPTMTKA